MGKNQAVAGLVLSIAGLVLSFIGGWFSIVGLPVAIVGLVLSVIGRKKLMADNQPAGIGTAGLVVGIIAVVFASIFFFTCGVCTLYVEDKVDEVNDALNELNDLLG